MSDEVKSLYIEDHQCRYRIEDGGIRTEGYGPDNTFIGGVFLDGDECLEVMALIENWAADREPLPHLKRRFDPPEIYGPPHFADYKSPSDA
jgi:hypothetical protein